MQLPKLLLKLLVALSLFLPSLLFAGHLIGITPLTPFPSKITTSATAKASYRVTNLASAISVTVVDESRFPAGSGFAISSSSCGGLLKPGQFCDINLSVTAPATPQVISGELRERASPSIDGVKLPISITVTGGVSHFVVTPSAGSGGSISPNTPQTVNSGASLTFTGTPNAGFSLGQWLLDGSVVQTGGATYTLRNITASHTIQVTFQAPAVAFAAGILSNSNPFIVATSDGGGSWGVKPIGGLALSGTSIRGGFCSGSGANAVCMASGTSHPSGQQAAVFVSQNGGASWTNATMPPNLTGLIRASGGSGEGATAIGVVVGDVSGLTPTLLVSRDAGSTWVNKGVSGDTEVFRSVSCTGNFCAAVGATDAIAATGAIYFSQNGAQTWTVESQTSPVSDAFLAVSCTDNLFCAALTENGDLVRSQNGGTNWVGPSNIGIVQLSGLSCAGSGSSILCAAIGNLGIQVSHDAGATWVGVAIPSGSFVQSSVSCTQGSSGIFCAAVGINTSQVPVIFASTDGAGLSWSQVSIQGGSALTSSPDHVSVSCAPNGASALCAVTAGQDISTSAPILIVSTDILNAPWIYQTPQTIPNLTTNGNFNNAGASASLN